MKIVSAAGYEELSKKAAGYICRKVQEHPAAVLGFATGGTPEGAYRHLVENYRKKEVSFAEVKTINLDEYIGLPPTHPNSYHFYMSEHLFQHVNIKKENIHLPDGLARDLDKECVRYEKLITELGGADIQLLGIGTNGHIGFNEPGTSFKSDTHVITLAPSTKKENARFFRNSEEVPDQAITMGIHSILKSKEILLLAAGRKKAEAVKRLLEENVNEYFPASALKLHSYVTIIADEKALSLLGEEDRKRIEK